MKNKIWYIHNWILLSLKEKTDMSCNMTEPWGFNAKWNKPVTKTQTFLFHLYLVTRVHKFTETERRRVVTKGQREGRTESCCLMGGEFQFCKMKSVLKINCTTTWMYSTLLKHYSFKDGKLCFMCDYIKKILLRFDSKQNSVKQLSFN